jgi:hypothetical protein
MDVSQLREALADSEVNENKIIVAATAIAAAFVGNMNASLFDLQEPEYEAIAGLARGIARNIVYGPRKDGESKP